MTPKHLYVLLLAIVAASGVCAQSEDIPVENDNQFPPDTPEKPSIDVLEGSGDGAGEDPRTLSGTTEVTSEAPQIEQVLPTNGVLQPVAPEGTLCPTPCVCNYEGGADNFVVECSRYKLKEFPSPIDPKTTTLNIQNNELTEIPKEVSSLTNLKILNAENNKIMDLASGSVSNLPELKVLKLANNSLIEYPKDLKNSLSLTKLEELDLGGNDIRGDLKPEILSNLKALRVVTFPASTPVLLEELCHSLKETLSSVCIESCNKQLHECGETISKLSDEGLLDALPAYEPDHSDADINDINTEEPSVNTNTEDTLQEPSINTNSEIKPQNTTNLNSILAPGGALLDTNQQQHEESTVNNDKDSKQQNNMDDLSLILTLGGALLPGQKQTNNTGESVANNPELEKNMESRKIDIPEAGATVEATTAEGKNGGGGVDKSVIGIVVAAMVVVVAGITIKKNWSSIKRKFSSSPRPADRAGAGANGTTPPEEVPLQDKEKSPV